MSLKELYQPGGVPAADSLNEEGSTAYRNSPKWRLAKMLTTGMVGHTFYAEAKTLNLRLLELAWEVDETFLAKAIVYAREQGLMRANPLQLLVVLSVRNPALFRRIFRRVVLTGGDLLDFATVVLHGNIRKEFGTAARQEVAHFLNTADAYQFIKYGSKRQKPSFDDLIRLTHPKPLDDERDHLFRWMLGMKDKVTRQPAWREDLLPEKVRELIQFRQASRGDDEFSDTRAKLLETGHLPHEAVTGYALNKSEWQILGEKMPYMATLRHLNTFKRRGLFTNPWFTEAIAAKLSNEEAVKHSRQFPYRFLTASQSADDLPEPIQSALDRALDVSLRNIPSLDGLVVVSPDVSGSMHGTVHHNSQVRYIDVAGLITASILRKNPQALILPFDTKIHGISLKTTDSVFTNSRLLASYGGGGTNVSLPFEALLASEELVRELRFFIGITDSESWVDAGPWGSTTRTTELWSRIHSLNNQARCLLINVAPYPTDQLSEQLPGVTFVSGFSDEVFRLMGILSQGGVASQVDAIEAHSLD